MASDVDIANLALSKLGKKSIVAFTDDSPPARLANLTYNDYRDSLLRDHLWNFALVRTSLAAVATGPEWEYDYAYTLPSAPNWCLRVVDVENDSRLPWKVEGRQIVTDITPPLNILYIKRVTDPEQFDAAFVEALAAYLAMEWCEKMTGSTTLRQQLSEMYRAKISAARSVDGREGTLNQLDTYEWIDARF